MLQSMLSVSCVDRPPWFWQIYLRRVSLAQCSQSPLPRPNPGLFSRIPSCGRPLSVSLSLKLKPICFADCRWSSNPLCLDRWEVLVQVFFNSELLPTRDAASVASHAKEPSPERIKVAGTAEAPNPAEACSRLAALRSNHNSSVKNTS